MTTTTLNHNPEKLSLEDKITLIIKNSFRDTPLYAPNNLNQYTDVGGTAYSYDANGNLLSDGVNTYTFDYENRLTAITGSTSATYAYDGFGRRVAKTVGSVTTYFIYDGNQVIEEIDPSADLLIAQYVYGAGIDEVLRMERQGKEYYFHYDGLGSVTDITNLANEVIETYSYDVYGKPTIRNPLGQTIPNSAIGNRVMFTGREWESETGLYHYRARVYSPTIGRFLQRDPVTWGPDDRRILNSNTILQRLFPATHLITSNFNGSSLSTIFRDYILEFGYRNPQFTHPYMYSLNNPTNYIDPLGLYVEKSIWEKAWDRFDLALGINTEGKYFNSLVYWSSVANQIIVNIKGILIGAIGPQLVIPPPWGQIVAGTIMFSIGSGIATNAYKEAWIEIFPNTDPYPQIKKDDY